MVALSVLCSTALVRQRDLCSAHDQSSGLDRPRCISLMADYRMRSQLLSIYGDAHKDGRVALGKSTPGLECCEDNVAQFNM